MKFLISFYLTEPLVSLASGCVIWELDYFEGSSEPVHGKMIKEDEPICGLQTRYGLEQIGSFCTGRIVGIEKKQGEMLRKGEINAFIEKK